MFGTLELMMLAPVEMGERGLNIAIESVSPLDCGDLCAAAAMTEHFKRVPKMRKLALGSRTLFDVTVNRLTKSVMEATYPRPSLVAARRKGNNLSSPMANWNRLLHAVRQGASAHRAVQLLAWVRAALAGAEGAAHERADIVGRYDSLAALVHACFVFEPEKHRATPAAAADARFPASRFRRSRRSRRHHRTQSARARDLHGRHRPRRGRRCTSARF